MEPDESNELASTNENETIAPTPPVKHVDDPSMVGVCATELEARLMVQDQSPVTPTEQIVLTNLRELPQLVQQRLEVVQQLQQLRGTPNYSEAQRLLARKLGISVRSLQRLVRAYSLKGIEGLERRIRVDKGDPKTDKEWRDFIVKTYRAGNRGSTRLSRAQVAVRVKARAMELGVAEYPSRATVYRILLPEIEKKSIQRSQTKKARA